MGQIKPGVNLVVLSGYSYTLKGTGAVAWATNVLAVYRANTSTGGWQSLQPNNTGSFDAFTTIDDGGSYYIQVASGTTPFEVAGVNDAVGADLTGLEELLAQVVNPTWYTFTGTGISTGLSLPYCIRYTSAGSIELAGTGAVDGIVFDRVDDGFYIASTGAVFERSGTLATGTYYRAQTGAGVTTTEPVNVGQVWNRLFRVSATNPNKIVVNIPFPEGIEVVEVTSGGETQTAPAAPTNLAYSLGGTFNDEVTLTWNAVTGADSYSIQRRYLGGTDADWVEQANSVTSTNYLDTIPSQDGWEYRVQGVNEAGAGAWSAILTVPATNATLPDAPSTIYISNITTSGYTADADTSTDNN